MNSPETTSRYASPYKEGADQGFLFGIYLSVMFVLWVLAAQVPVLMLIMLAMAACVPLVIYRFLRRTFLTQNGFPTVMSMWVQGITIMICAALICGVLVIVWFKWIDPGFMAGQLQRVIDLYDATQDPSLAETARLSRLILENHALPSAGTWTLSMWLFTVFSGSILSCLMALLVKARGLPAARPINR